MKIADHIKGIRRPILVPVLIADLLLGWMVIGWGPWSLLTSLIKGREQPIIWGTILSMPVPVVATTIIVSLRLLQAGQEEDRGQRIGAQPRALDREGQAAVRLALAQQIEEQRIQEQQARAQRPGAQQPRAQQPGAQQPGVQQPRAQQPGVQQPEAQQAQEQPIAQIMPPDQVKQAQDWLKQMQDQLLRLQAQVPEMQQPAAQLLEQLREIQGNMSQMTSSEIEERMRRMQEQMGHLQGLPGGIPPEAQADLARMQQQMAQMMAQVMTQTMVQMQQAGVQPPVVLQPEEQQDEDETELDLEDLDLPEEDFSSLFDVEEVENPYLAALSKGLEDIDMFDLLEECKEMAGQLRRGNSLVSKVIREHRQKEAEL